MNLSWIQIRPPDGSLTYVNRGDNIPSSLSRVERAEVVLVVKIRSGGVGAIESNMASKTRESGELLRKTRETMSRLAKEADERTSK